jgi:site-specific recombinase XerD
MASIDKRSGGYRVRYRDPLGRQRTRQFRRKTDADRFAREVEVDKNRGAWIDPRSADMPLSEWVETFMSLARSLAPTTQETYRRDLDRYVLPRFGARRLGHLGAEEIEQWLNDELASGLASSSVHRHYRTLRRVLQTAVEKDRLQKNPCDRVRPPKVTTRKMAVLDWPQCVALAEAHSDRYRALIYLALDSGMRWSELTGLRRDHVEVERRKVRVTEQLVQLADRSRVRRVPKTSAGARSITISATTAAILGHHLELYAEPEADALVFTNGAGAPITHSSFQTHHFKPALAAAGVTSRFHDLRHTSVALAISAGAHPKAIQVRMGHSSITVTLDRYGHLFPELDEAIADAFDERWLAARSAAGIHPAPAP